MSRRGTLLAFVGSLAASAEDAREAARAIDSRRRARIGRPCTFSIAFGTVALRPPKSAPAAAASTIAESGAVRVGR